MSDGSSTWSALQWPVSRPRVITPDREQHVPAAGKRAIAEVVLDAIEVLRA